MARSVVGLRPPVSNFNLLLKGNTVISMSRLLVGLLLLASYATRAESLPDPGDKRYPAKLEYVLSYNASLAPPEVIGPLPEGIRVNFYVTGGLFKGPNIKGKVRPVGGDWLTLRKDGIGILDVRATMETDDGALIYIAYTGTLDLGPTGYKDFAEGKLPEFIKLTVASRMHTANPKYEWVNRSQYVQFGEFERDKLLVRYDVYVLQR
jgi:hypothetical protein